MHCATKTSRSALNSASAGTKCAIEVLHASAKSFCTGLGHV